MSIRILESVRKAIAVRANYRCEYCRVPDLGDGLRFHIDHIRSQKHDGETVFDNLAFCCPDCNHFKGSDLDSIPIGQPHLIRFFNPRSDHWSDHFEFKNGIIESRTEIGQVTAKIFQFNKISRIYERRLLLDAGFL